MLKIPSNEAWAGNQVEGLPGRWKGCLLARWENVRSNIDHSKISGKNDAGRVANIELREITEKLRLVRLPLDASDGDICVRAEELSAACMALGSVFHQVEELRAAMGRTCESNGVMPPGEKIKDRPAILRMTCRDWWRRGLRKMHAKAVEGAAIQLGYVNKARDLYVSNESLERRAQQNRRNAATLENTIMRNELEQEFTLAELCEKGTANKAIRRGELMTRIAGFEKIAIECGHGGLFLTVTCPSRMHKWNSAGAGKVYENPKYDGTTPKQAQAHLSKCYGRIRATLARKGIGIYGFRIAEPHHDGCPHWHILLFHEAGKEQEITAIFRRYLLADSPDEAGAAQHRVASEVIDWSRGTAAGYIAKYVAKNIDGLHVENDPYGNPALETSRRVEAWAATWGIRQFQQVGGAPVGVWREMRRVKELPENAPAHLVAAHIAVNKIEGEGETKSADWAEYVKAQGGVFCGSDALIRIAREETGEIGRYGELIAARPVGVVTIGAEVRRDGVAGALVAWLVQSVRHVWEVVKRGVKRGGFLPPWTCVNNYTREGVDGGEKNSARTAGRSRTEIQPAFRSGEKSSGRGNAPDFGTFAGDFI